MRRWLVFVSALFIAVCAFALTQVMYSRPTFDECVGVAYQALMFPPHSTDARFAALGLGARPRHGEYQYPPSDVGWMLGVNQAFRPPAHAVCLGFPLESGGYDVVRCRYQVDGRHVEYFRSGDLAGLCVERRGLPADDDEAVATLFGRIFVREEMIEPMVVGRTAGRVFGGADPDRPGRGRGYLARGTVRWSLTDESFCFAAYPNLFGRRPHVDAPTKGELTPFFDPDSFEYRIPEGESWLRASRRVGASNRDAHTLEWGVEPVTFQYPGVAPVFALKPGDRCVGYWDDVMKRDVAGCFAPTDQILTVTDGRHFLLVVRGFDGTPQDIVDAVLEPSFPLTEIRRGAKRAYGRIGTELSPMWWWYQDRALYLLAPRGTRHMEARWLRQNAGDHGQRPSKGRSDR